jgi:hypothetical protein
MNFSSILAIVFGVAALVQTIRLKRIEMITADEVTQLVNALNFALQAEANNASALQSAQAQIAQLTANNTALNDPALQTAVNNALTAAAAANPPPPATTPPASTTPPADGGGTAPAPTPTS